jgi:ribosomal protein S18 acetylase RimI-like enzyme
MSAKLFINNESHYKDFIALNELWITEHFTLEANDIVLAKNTESVVLKGGYILSLFESEQVVAVCALFKQDNGEFELSRLAVDESYRRKGYGERLVNEAIKILQENNIKKVSLMSNTKLKAAISLYKKNGFKVLYEGKHPVYSRTNIVMERNI